ncbi:hypothetical protein [Oceanibaculum indicum]|uniref:hypothetical protein n=1 Tax=Oceanibaculum indicum TaxID=526216 RepID=UPI0011C43801|nr:hypothetical protein [Oceanibaculum indicum]
MAIFTFDIFLPEEEDLNTTKLKKDMTTFYNAMTSYPISISAEDEYKFESNFIRRVAITNGAISATIALSKEYIEETDSEKHEYIFKELAKNRNHAEKLIQKSLPVMENFKNNLLRTIKNNT